MSHSLSFQHPLNNPLVVPYIVPLRSSDYSSYEDSTHSEGLQSLHARQWPPGNGDFPKRGVPAIMENQVEKKMENEMETGTIYGIIGVRVSQNEGRLLGGPYTKDCGILGSV